MTRAAQDNGKHHLPALVAEHFGMSRSEARRLLGQGGVRLDGEPLGTGPGRRRGSPERTAVLQVGRRRFKRIRVAS